MAARFRIDRRSDAYKRRDRAGWERLWSLLAVVLIAAAPAAPDSSGFVPAPLPDADITAPESPQQTQGTHFAPRLWQPVPAAPGAAGGSTLPGLTTQSAKDRYSLPSPGVNLTVPLK